MKERILTPEEVADIVARYTAEPPATIIELCRIHHTSDRTIKAALRRAGVRLHGVRRDPCEKSTTHIPALDWRLTKAERAARQLAGYFSGEVRR